MGRKIAKGKWDGTDGEAGLKLYIFISSLTLLIPIQGTMVALDFPFLSHSIQSQTNAYFATIVPFPLLSTLLPVVSYV